MSKPEIKAEIDASLAARSARTEVTADRIVKELAGIAFASLEEYRPVDKLKALELLGRHLAMFTDRAVVDVQQTRPVAVIVDAVLGELEK